jgi:dihydrofolate synthase/folylpolyglutamate synthase
MWKNTGLQEMATKRESRKLFAIHTQTRTGSGIESNPNKKFEQLHILGVVNDKDLEEILPLFPKNAIYYFSKPNNPRGLDATILAEKQEQTA